MAVTGTEPISAANLQAIFNTDGGSSPIADAIYPVGSIYMSVNAANPSTLFGGKWQRIQGRFLFAADSSHAAGSTGGEETHKLTVDEMPAHDHDMYQSDNNSREYSDYLVSREGYSTTDVFGMASTQGIGGSHSFRVSTMSNSGYAEGYRVVTKEGGDKPHNNMPPYLSVYVWKRTA